MTGLLLSNLGTPDEATTPAVRRYLKQFLSDPRVLDIGAVGRWALLNLFILPTRPAKSAAAYRKIWGEGSPLLRHGRALQTAVQAKLGSEWLVELGMRYGEPSIEGALDRLRKRGVDRIVFFPLYPQYAASSTGSSIEELYRIAGTRWVTPTIATVEPFYDDAGFIRAFAEIGNETIGKANADYALFSYHGLPERQVVKTDDTGAHCLRSATCCDAIVEANRNCYRAQCYATTRAMVAAMKLAIPHSVSFQSRLGRTPWIKPYTDLVLPELAQKGVKRPVVLCPAFVADCLETLEEIGVRANEQWRALGGDTLTLVPSLNASPTWVDAVVELVHAQARRFDGGR
jgi:ferrochelatase